jgi:hypothetical protein
MKLIQIMKLRANEIDSDHETIIPSYAAHKVCRLQGTLCTTTKVLRAVIRTARLQI